MLILCISLLAIVERINAQGQASGNAIDLANMNMNMMHTKCPLEACQSVCLVKQPETGCFVCNPKCNSGTNLGMPDSGMPMNLQPINSGQVGFYSRCEHDNWMQCPMSCARKFDQTGCFKCLCQTSSKVQATTKQVPTLTLPPSMLPVTSSVTSSSTSRTPLSSTTYRTTSTRQARTSAITIQSTTRKSSQKINSQEQESVTNPVTKSYPEVITQNRDSHRKNEVRLYNDRERNVTLSFTDNQKDVGSHNTNQIENDNFKPNNLTFILFGIMTVLATLVFVFLIAWKKSSRKLRKNKDELYFVHKAYRQDSRARLSHNEMMDPVYADIGPRPEPPPRSPPSIRSNTLSAGPERSLSQSSETPLKEQNEDVKHDYLELI